MHRKFHEKLGEMLRRNAPFVVATVINVRGSAVAKPGAKAVIDAQGCPVFGWVGGGCVESFVCAEAVAALALGVPRVITADLEDELAGVGLPCGGVMEIFIEPVAPRRRVLVVGTSELALEAARMAERSGFAVTLCEPSHSPPGQGETERLSARFIQGVSDGRGALLIIAGVGGEDLCGLARALEAEPDYVALLTESDAGAQVLEQLKDCGLREEALARVRLGAGLDLGGSSVAERALSVVAELLAVLRGASARSLQEIKLGEQVLTGACVPARVSQPELVIVGHSQITEELAWLASRLGWRVTVDSASASAESYPVGVRFVRDDADFSRLPATSEAAVIVATHHKGDHLAIGHAFDRGAWYVGLIASAHRSKLVRGMLGEATSVEARLKCLRTPAGLDLGATQPAEIALSIMSEVLASYHGRPGLPRPAAQPYEKSRR
jgi:xanthine dehydrogenase accessory factor